MAEGATVPIRTQRSPPWIIVCVPSAVVNITQQTDSDCGKQVSL